MRQEIGVSERRACRALREGFLRVTGGRPLLLPRMQALGEGPLTAGFEGVVRIDAAHNEAGARELAKAINNVHTESSVSVLFV